jgi:hypothetical protein
MARDGHTCQHLFSLPFFFFPLSLSTVSRWPLPSPEAVTPLRRPPLPPSLAPDAALPYASISSLIYVSHPRCPPICPNTARREDAVLGERLCEGLDHGTSSSSTAFQPPSLLSTSRLPHRRSEHDESLGSLPPTRRISMSTDVTRQI